MGTIIRIATEDVSLRAEMNGSTAAEQFLSLLPLEITMSRWGDEYYGNCGVAVDLTPGAKTEMDVGELAIWPVGGAFCIFFGPTPASRGDRPVAASPVVPIGRLLDSPEPLRTRGSSIIVTMSLSA